MDAMGLTCSVKSSTPMLEHINVNPVSPRVFRAPPRLSLHVFSVVSCLPKRSLRKSSTFQCSARTNTEAPKGLVGFRQSFLHCPAVALTGSKYELRAAPQLLARRNAWKKSGFQPQASVVESLVAGDMELLTAAAAVGSAAAAALSLPVSVTRIEGDAAGVLALTGQDFLTLCRAQLELAASILGPETNFTVFVRTPESYTLGQLDLRQVASFPPTAETESDVLSLVGPLGDALPRDEAEQALLRHEVVELPESQTLVLPLKKETLLVGLLVIQRPSKATETTTHSKPSSSGLALSESAKSRGGMPVLKPPPMRPEMPDARDSDRWQAMEKQSVLSAKEQEVVPSVARTLAAAIVLDQRAVLLQQASWQKGVRLDKLLEQVRGPLTAIRTLGKMLLPQLRKGEVSRDIAENMVLQGDRMKEVVGQLQSAVAAQEPPSVPNTSPFQSPFNNPPLNHPPWSSLSWQQQLDSESLDPRVADTRFLERGGEEDLLGRGGGGNGRMACLPLAVEAVERETSASSDVGAILSQLIYASQPLANQREFTLQHVSPPPGTLPLVAADAFELRQALGMVLDIAMQHTIEGGLVHVETRECKTGGALLVVENCGAPLPASDSTLQLAKSQLESLGCVLRLKSFDIVAKGPNRGGGRVEVWLPAARSQGHEVGDGATFAWLDADVGIG